MNGEKASRLHLLQYCILKKMFGINEDAMKVFHNFDETSTTFERNLNAMLTSLIPKKPRAVDNKVL